MTSRLLMQCGFETIIIFFSFLCCICFRLYCILFPLRVIPVNGIELVDVIYSRRININIGCQKMPNSDGNNIYVSLEHRSSHKQHRYIIANNTLLNYTFLF